ncbi:phage major capsid protein [Bacillus sp. F19]|nr:phage major capsid protein [Bacillus sp. F19]
MEKLNQMELRTIDVELSGVTQESGDLLVSGYVNKTGEWSQLLGREQRFKERIMPGTFKNALNKGNDVLFLAEHDNAKLLASTKNGSLTLKEDDIGLHMEARISATSWGRDYHTLISDGLLTNMSFGMQVASDKWEKRDDGTYERSIEDLTLAEVSVVRSPAYIQSTIQARSIEVIEAEPVFFMPKNQKNEKEDVKMSKEKQLKELRAQMDVLQAEVNTEKAVQVEEVRAIPEVDVEEQEIRAVEQYIKGNVQAEEVRAIMTTGTQAITVPKTLSSLIVEKLYQTAPLFARTKNFQPVSGTLEILREDDLTAAGWFGELENATESEFSFTKVELTQKRAATAISLSNQLINDSGIGIVDYAANILTRRLGLTLDRNILNGTGQKSGATANELKQMEGINFSAEVQLIDAAAPAASLAITIDDLLDVYNNMHPTLVPGAVWIMNRLTFNMIAKLKDNNGHFYLVRDVAETGAVYKLFGQPVLINDAAENVAAGKRPVTFANLEAGYATMIKKGAELKRISDDTTQALRGSQLLMLDIYTDGRIFNHEAIKQLRCKTV